MAYHVAHGVTIKQTDAGTVVLDEKTGAYRILNISGAIVLRALLEHEGADPLAHAIAELNTRYPSAVDQIPDDVLAVVRQLVDAKVVVVS